MFSALLDYVVVQVAKGLLNGRVLSGETLLKVVAF